VFEKLAKIADPNPSCPKVARQAEVTPGAPPQEEAEGEEEATPPQECGCPTVKVITGGTFHLKGSGWASDGYA
jgi:hypothetical protein